MPPLWLPFSLLFLLSHRALCALVDTSQCKLPAQQSTYLSLGFNYDLDCVAPTGQLRAFMIFVDFPDAPATETPRSLYNVLLPGAADWYATASYGRLRLSVTADTSAFYRMPGRSDSYGWDRDFSEDDHEVYINDAAEAYFDAHPSSSPRSVDLLYVVPTARAASIYFSPTYMSEVRTRAVIAKKAVTFGQDVFTTWGFKTLNHETGHALCLPDLYPFSSDQTGLYVGGWDVMGLISGPAPDYIAWNKWRLGWIDDGQVQCVAGGGTTRHVLTPLAVSGGVKAVVVRRNSTLALVAEARTRAGLDGAACATGVLLYTVSTNVETGEGPVRVLDTRPNSRGCSEDELNDAPLSLDRTSTYTVPGWGVKVAVVSQTGTSYTIQVTVP